MINYSFIIPHHNSPELLNRCIASIPVREDIQIIVVDDNSKEELRPCIDRDGVEIIYIDAQHTKGAGRARNIGMTMAIGKWLLFADCDDYYEDGFLDVLDGYKDKNIDILYFNYNVFDEILNTPINKGAVQQSLDMFILDKLSEDIIHFRNNAPWNKMVKNSLVTKYSLNFEETPNGNDILFSLKLSLSSSNFLHTPISLYNYVIHKNSISTKKPTIDEVVCSFEHDIKKFNFNKAVGHREWNVSVIKLFYSIYLTNGFFLLLIVTFKVLLHLINRNFRPKEWALMIT